MFCFIVFVFIVFWGIGCEVMVGSICILECIFVWYFVIFIISFGIFKFCFIVLFSLFVDDVFKVFVYLFLIFLGD